MADELIAQQRSEDEGNGAVTTIDDAPPKYSYPLLIDEEYPIKLVFTAYEIDFTKSKQWDAIEKETSNIRNIAQEGVENIQENPYKSLSGTAGATALGSIIGGAFGRPNTGAAVGFVTGVGAASGKTGELFSSVAEIGAQGAALTSYDNYLESSTPKGTVSLPMQRGLQYNDKVSYTPESTNFGAGTIGAISSLFGDENGKLSEAATGRISQLAARVAGAFATPMALSGVKNKTSQMLAKRAQEKPALQSAKDSQSQAYKDFEAAGGRVSVKMDDVIKRIETKINQDDLFIGYEPRIGGRSNFVDEARQSVIKHAGKDFNLVKLDALKRSLNDTYKASNFDPRVKFIADEIDEIIGTTPNIGSQSAFSLLEKARSETRRVKKIEMFEELIDMAERGAAKTGSGGNVVNKYRQAVDKILSQPSRRRQFDKDELELMDKFVRGSMDENALRLIGKLSPSGNGLMAALNLYAIAQNPIYATAAITGTVAKGAAEGKAIKSVDQLRKLIESGVAPAKRKLITDRELRILLGLQASEAGE